MTAISLQAQNQRAIILVSSTLLSITLHLYFSQIFTASSSAWLSILVYLLFQHGTKKSLPPLQYTCSCQPYRRQFRTSTQPQQQTGVTLSPHHRQENTSPQDQTRVQANHTPLAWTDSARTVHYIVIDKQENAYCIHGSLPSAHTPTNFV